MIRVKDTYVVARDIMAIELETETKYILYQSEPDIKYTMIIRYFNEASVRIVMDTKDEYFEIADMIRDKVEYLEANDNGNIRR